jgi:hypothetical protein
MPSVAMQFDVAPLDRGTNRAEKQYNKSIPSGNGKWREYNMGPMQSHRLDTRGMNSSQ